MYLYASVPALRRLCIDMAHDSGTGPFQHANEAMAGQTVDQTRIARVQLTAMMSLSVLRWWHYWVSICVGSSGTLILALHEIGRALSTQPP